ncbi:MAG: hypothetical protein P8Y28_11305 [Gammaproteobacteria bacterium]|jgi:hypothetical protein
MTTKHITLGKHADKQMSGKQKGFFDFGLGLGLFLAFAGTAAVVTANEKNKSTEESSVVQEQSSQSQRYALYDTDC